MLGEYCGREGRGRSGQAHTPPVTPDTVLAEAPARQLGTESQCQGLVGVIGGQWGWLAGFVSADASNPGAIRTSASQTQGAHPTSLPNAPVR